MANFTENITAITAPCTCSVDGVSGDVLVRYNGYTFAGCGAHITFPRCSRVTGFDYALCLVTSPEDCPEHPPSVPDWLDRDSVRYKWRSEGAMAKSCHDGYRCEAWWGDLEGGTIGTPVVLEAPLDWPDCCALCSNMTEGVSCEGWSFTPSTGSCQLLSTFGHLHKSAVWGMNTSISGFPGYFEAPPKVCWEGEESGTCEILYALFLALGIVLAFCGCLVVLASGLDTNALDIDLLKNDHLETCLVKAACIEVCVTSVQDYIGCEEVNITYYSGKFVTLNGTIVKIPCLGHLTRGRGEQDMLRILFHTETRPLGETNPTSPCGRTPIALRRCFAHLKRRSLGARRPSNGGNLVVNGDDHGPTQYDCLLLFELPRDAQNPTSPHWRMVNLVGVLGEDRITCMDPCRIPWFHVGCLFVGSILIIFVLAVQLNLYYAAEAITRWTRPATHCRDGAVVGLVLVPVLAVAVSAVPVLVNVIGRRHLLEALAPADMRGIF